MTSAVHAHLFWITSRAAGTAGLLLSSVSVAVGVTIGGKLVKGRGPDLRVLHEALSLATIVAVVVHAGMLLGDSYLRPTVLDLTVPFVSSYKTAWMSIGIVGGWSMVVLGLSYYARARIGQERWRRLHRLSGVAWALGIVHSLGEGTDAGQAWFLASAAIVTLPAAMLLVVRMLPRAGARGGVVVVSIVIAGGGLAAQRCVETLRRCGYDGAITMVCAEAHRPYDRPPLSKAVLAEAEAEAGLGFRGAGWYAERSVELLLGVAASGLDTGARRLRRSDGGWLAYEQLLIATGSRPRRLGLLEPFANVSTLRTVEDARALRAALGEGGRLAIVGAGFIGQEVASAARGLGVETTVIELEPLPLGRLLGPVLGAWLRDMHVAEGVELLLGARLAGARGGERVEALVLADGREVACEHVVVGIGVEPDLDWLSGSGLPSAGVPVDVDGRTAVPGVFAAGDAAATFDRKLGRRVTGGHWESAGRAGARAGKAMLGADPGPVTVASFWSDLYGTRIQYLGHAGLADEISIDGDPAARDFAATFTRDGLPVAAFLAGRPRALPQARALLSA